MKICPNCGVQNEEDSLFCENCGFSLEKVLPEIASTEEITEKNQLAEEEILADSQATKKIPSIKSEEAKKVFCPNCGAENEVGAAFCSNCGYDLKVKPQINRQPEQPETKNELPAPSQRKPLSKKMKIWLGIAVAIVLFLAGGFFFGNYYYSYESQVERMATAFEDKDSDALTKFVTSDDPSYTVTAAKLEKLLDYYKLGANKKAFASFVSTLRQGGTLQDFILQQDGRFFGIFTRYQLVLEPVYLKVATSQTGMKLYLDDKEEATSKGSNYSVTWGPLTPGQYKIKGTLDGEEATSTANLVRFNNADFQSDSNLTLDLHKVSFKVTSNIEGAEVFLDDQKVATIQKGEAEVKDQVWHQGMKVHLTYKVGDQTLKSDTEVIRDGSYLAEDYDPDSAYTSVISLDFDNIQDKADLQYFLDDLYRDLSRYTTNYSDFGAEEKSHLAAYFVEGVNNSDEQDFEKFIEEIRNNDDKARVDAKAEVESVTMSGENQYTIAYLIYYDTVFSDYQKDDISQVFRYKKATLVYNEEEDQFQIQDLGGAENFETVDDGGAS